LEHPGLAYDDAVIFMDESLTLLPPQLLTSGLKALSQATDAYWSKTASPAIQQLSLNAIRRIVTTLPILLKKTDHHEAREQLMIGALMAAFALSNTRLSAATSTGLVISALTGMDPGLASVMILPELLRHNLGALKNPESLYEAFNIDNPEGLMTWIENNAFGLDSVKLSDHAVQPDDLNRLSAMIDGLGMMKNNIVTLTIDQLTAFLKRHL
jgi:alcohol dehydrogenase class IV